MHLHKKLYSPILVIIYSLILMIVGLTMTNIVLFVVSYYLLLTSIFVYDKKKKKKFVSKRLTASYWDEENHLKEIIDNNNVTMSREYFDVSPIPRHETTYKTHPNPKFER